MTHPRKADRVAADLMRRIVSGALATGSLLPKEAELGKRYRVNRSVVREAVKQLEVHRLVQPIKRRGTVVLDPLRSPSPDVVHAMLFPQPGVADERALRELLEIRARLDIEMTGLAAERHTPADMVRIDGCVAVLESCLGDAERYAAAMDDLASALAAATHNRIYQMLVHWHERVRVDLPELQMVVRLANAPHLQGVRFMVELVRRGEAADVRGFVAAVHEWATPRIIAAAALVRGGPIESVMEELTA